MKTRIYAAPVVEGFLKFQYLFDLDKNEVFSPSRQYWWIHAMAVIIWYDKLFHLTLHMTMILHWSFNKTTLTALDNKI